MPKNIFLILAVSAICAAQNIEKFPAEYVPFAITPGPDGALWMVPSAQSPSYDVGRITTSGAFSQFPPPAGFVPVGSIVTGSDGALWLAVADTENTAILRMTTAGTSASYAYALPDGVYAMAAGPDGAIWLAEFDRIGRITTSGSYSFFSIGPYYPMSITAGPDGNLWFPAIDSDGNSYIGQITPAGVVKMFPLSSLVAIYPANGIAAGPDGALWFMIDAVPGSQVAAIGRITTSGTVSTFSIPNSSTYNFTGGSIAASPDGGLWFTGNGALGRITTAGAASVYPLSSASWATYSDGVGLGIAAGPDAGMWFAAFSNQGVGRAALNASPQITQITPDQIAVDSPATPLRILGNNLAGTSSAPCTGSPQSVTWGTTPLTVTNASASEIDATVPATLLTTIGGYTVTVGVQQVNAGACATVTTSGAVQVTASASANVSPGSLSFPTTAGQIPAPQTFLISSTSGTVSYSLNVTYAASEPVNWVDLSSSSGSVSAGTPATIMVSIASAVSTFAAGTYTATVNVTEASATASVAITLTVNPPAAPHATTTTLTASPASQASGQPVLLTAAVTPSTATGMVNFLDGTNSLGSITLASGTATLNTSTLSVGAHTLTASYGGDAGDAPSNSAPVSVTITNPNQATILAGGILNAASYAEINGAGAPVAPGSLVAIFTSPLATQAASFSTATLPPVLANVSVTFNGVTAPMVTVQPGGAYPYVSAQVPFEALPAGQTSATVPVVITVNNVPSAPVNAAIVASSPGIFTIPATGQGNAVLVNLSDYSIAAPAGSISGSHPIARGQSAFFYVTGLGSMTPAVADGSGDCTAPNGLCNANALPQVFVGGVQVSDIAFAGQAPEYPGVQQINITIPQNAPTGNTVSLVVISADGTVTSNTATIAVQ